MRRGRRVCDVSFEPRFLERYRRVEGRRHLRADGEHGGVKVEGEHEQHDGVEKPERVRPGWHLVSSARRRALVSVVRARFSRSSSGGGSW